MGTPPKEWHNQPMDLKGYSCLVFDWNGTVVDDRHLCHVLLNRMLRQSGHPEVSFERYLEIFRFPVKEYYKDAGFRFAPEGKDDFAALAHYFRDEYEREFPSLGLYPGVKELITKARSFVPVYLLSATREDLLLSEVRQKDLAGSFTDAIGIKDIYGGGKLDAGRAYFNERGIDLGRALFIGDTLHDEEVARSLGGEVVLVASGHQSKERLLSEKQPATKCLDTIRDLAELLFD